MNEAEKAQSEQLTISVLEDEERLQQVRQEHAQKENALADAAKKRAAVSSVLWSALLTLIKLIAGISTNSLGLLSEALHSLLDFVAAGITCLAVRISAQPADEKHPYGHGKAESLAALAETALLAITCVWIVKEAVERLWGCAAPVEPSWWAFAVVLISLGVDISRSAMLRRVAREHKSQALEADAMHFTTDIWSSAVVLAGLCCAGAAGYVQKDTILHTLLVRADAVAALGVACIVFSVSWNMARNAVLTLMDGGMSREAQRIRAALAANAPAYAVRSVRVRESGARQFVDLVVSAPAGLRMDGAHEITTMMENIVSGVLPSAETAVHMEPDDASPRDLYATSYRLASLHGLMIHSLRLVTLDDGMHIEVHIELPSDMPLSQAHALVSAYEADLKRRVGAVYVVSHIEPVDEAVSNRNAVDHALVEQTVHKALQNSAFSDAHHIHIRTGRDGTSVTFHCRTCAATVAEAHEQCSRLESDIRAALPSLGRVTIHAEPDSQNSAG